MNILLLGTPFSWVVLGTTMTILGAAMVLNGDWRSRSESRVQLQGKDQEIEALRQDLEQKTRPTSLRIGPHTISKLPDGQYLFEESLDPVGNQAIPLLEIGMHVRDGIALNDMSLEGEGVPTIVESNIEGPSDVTVRYRSVPAVPMKLKIYLSADPGRDIRVEIKPSEPI